MSPAPTLFRSPFMTPLGPMVALFSEGALCALEFDQPARLGLVNARLGRFFGEPQLIPFDPDRDGGGGAILRRTREWLDAYFAGRFEPVAVPLELRGTPFEMRVWELLQTIPAGARVSYGELAARLGSPTAARAVGGASRRNPIALLVPCHRVVGHGGSLTGYGGGLHNKEWLLRHESGTGLAATPRLSGSMSLFA
jgi:O-6-methylguanine DNA methyltransferase